MAASALLTAWQSPAIRAQGATYTFSLLAGGESSHHLDAVGHLAQVPEKPTHAGTSTTTLSVGPATTSMHGQRYRLTATNLSATVASNSATLSVNALTPTPSALRFGAHRVVAGTPLTITPAQRVTVLPSGAQAHTWTATADQPWVAISGGGATGAGQFTVDIVESLVRDLTGTLAATVTIAAPASAVSVALPVTLIIDSSLGFGPSPFGQVDTPAQDAGGLVGAVAVTGWVLDDVGVHTVKIYRNCLPFDTVCFTIGGVLGYGPVVELGDATIVPGARPDVEALYPNYPGSHRAGWGFMILSNMLPNVGAGLPHGGVGAVEIHVLAFGDYPGVTRLGRTVLDQAPTRITLANDTIAKPFGSIDTPTQGQTVGGTVNNFGWVLTPDPGTGVLVPPDGSTITAFVDGAALGTATYNLCRGTVGENPGPGVLCDDDVSTIFRGDGTTFRNLDAGRGPIGLRTIDTTTLSNGQHTLSWSVTDSAGRSEGIGSRYIEVVNGVSGPWTTAPTGDGGVGLPEPPQPRAGSRMEAVGPAGPVWARTGFDLRTAFAPLVPSAEGVPQVRIPELGRVELRLPGVTDGVLLVGGEVRELPIGVGIDRERGAATWVAGPGYLGTYRFVFHVGAPASGAAGTPSLVGRMADVTVAAGQTGFVPVRMELDWPSAAMPADGIRGRHEQSLDEPFERVEGWALDPQASSGSGIGAVHVWAKRTGAAAPATAVSGTAATLPPVFLGAADLHIHRPDVAAAHGAQFLEAGFRLMTALPPGEWEITAYVWVSRTGRFEDARNVAVRTR